MRGAGEKILKVRMFCELEKLGERAGVLERLGKGWIWAQESLVSNRGCFLGWTLEEVVLLLHLEASCWWGGGFSAFLYSSSG